MLAVLILGSMLLVGIGVFNPGRDLKYGLWLPLTATGALLPALPAIGGDWGEAYGALAALVTLGGANRGWLPDRACLALCGLSVGAFVVGLAIAG